MYLADVSFSSDSDLVTIALILWIIVAVLWIISWVLGRAGR